LFLNCSKKNAPLGCKANEIKYFGLSTFNSFHLHHKTEDGSKDKDFAIGKSAAVKRNPICTETFFYVLSVARVEELDNQGHLMSSTKVN
jgi:hypothetical protein